MAVPERAWAQPKFWALGLGEPFIADLCGKWLGLRLNDCVAAVAVIDGCKLNCSYRPDVVLGE
jgi:hypothetical protein